MKNKGAGTAVAVVIVVVVLVAGGVLFYVLFLKRWLIQRKLK